MKQIIQSFRSGETTLEDVPAPVVRKGTVLIKTTRTLVSAGTEKMLVEFGKANMFSKAIKQPEKVGMVMDKVKTDGLMPTIESVFNKLEQPIPLGYCNVGRIIEVGDGVKGFNVGDRVVSNGPHAEYVCIPQNLVAHIPDEVSEEDATFTVIGAIGLQSIRLLSPSIGETVAVMGLGLIGLITAQLLIANGCRVIGIDIDDDRLNLAEKWGVIPFNSRKGNVVKFVEEQTQQAGADGVIITASADTDEIIEQAAKMSRKRGKIVLVGVIGLKINRADFYEKELTFQVSCSYGPGRYDDNYEQRGNDYPLPYVRWTEKRNFEAILQCLATKKLKVDEMISETVDLQSFNNIYKNISGGKSIASILKYEGSPEDKGTTIQLSKRAYNQSKGVIGVIGAGNFTKMTMLPALKKAGAIHKYIASAGGLNAVSLAKKHGFQNATTDYKEILKDNEVDLVMITTRHDLHAGMITESLLAGKHVFVEKPLAIKEDDIDEIVKAYIASGKILAVGFNRRYSPHAVKLKESLGPGLMNVVATMNAGYIPENSWVHDMQIGGGRIIGEACHFIDLISFFTGNKVVAVCMNALDQNPKENTDNATILLKYENGSAGVINYFSNGSKKYAKERIEIFSQERTAVIDNWQVSQAVGFKNYSGLKTSLDKGHQQQFNTLVEAVRSGGKSLIPFESILNTTMAGFAAIESLKTGQWVHVKNQLT